MNAEEDLGFCTALDTFHVELGVDVCDAFASPKNYHRLESAPPPSPPPEPQLQPCAMMKHETVDQLENDDGDEEDGDDVDEDSSSDSNSSPNEATQTGRWTQKEHELFLEGLRRYGKSWKHIANLVATRTLVQIRTHAQKYLQKQSKAAIQSTAASSYWTHYRHQVDMHHDAIYPHRLPLPSFDCLHTNDIDQLLHDDGDDMSDENSDENNRHRVNDAMKIVAQLKPIAPSSAFHIIPAHKRRRLWEESQVHPLATYVDPSANPFIGYFPLPLAKTTAALHPLSRAS
ncbi:hypothetical protein AC1031_001422 [Aphanomyces cochlioides]|nr:hypothetical protein AC1031_001422 [Aphanomyces cochlioides]